MNILVRYSLHNAYQDCKHIDQSSLIQLSLHLLFYFTGELSWTVGGYSNELFQDAFTTYETDLCLPANVCHEFVISDSFGDGIGDGGDFTLRVNGNVLLQLGNGFQNEKSVKFGACDETSQCSDSSLARFRLELTTDNWGGETSFRVMRRRPNGKFKKKVFSGNGYESNADYVESKCLPKNKCYRLVVVDSFGDGLCCSDGQGSYKAYWKGKVFCLLFRFPYHIGVYYY